MPTHTRECEMLLGTAASARRRLARTCTTTQRHQMAMSLGLDERRLYARAIERGWHMLVTLEGRHRPNVRSEFSLGWEMTVRRTL